MNYWKRLFCWKKKLDISRKPYTYREWEHNSWGDAIQIIELKQPYLEIAGWLKWTPKVGDLFEIKMESGKIGIYRFTDVRECGNPKDMFFADLKGIGYKEEEQ